MKSGHRADRALVSIALFILLVAAGGILFDNWMWGHRWLGGEVVGRVIEKRGDVRFRLNRELQWQPALRGQELSYDDAVFAGDDSSAEIEVGEDRLILTENSMVVLRREKETNFLKLRFGSVFGTLAAHRKLKIETGHGKPVELESQTPTQILIQNSGEKTTLEVVGGAATLKTEKRSIPILRPTRVALGKTGPSGTGPVAPGEESRAELMEIEIVKPTRHQTVYSPDPLRLEFAWRLSSGREIKPDEIYTVEFSRKANFEEIIATKSVMGESRAFLIANQTTHLFFRVRGPDKTLSSTEAVNFVLLREPKILSPAPETYWGAKPNGRARVKFSFEAPDRESDVWWQVSRDSNFQKIVINEQNQKLNMEKELIPGDYFVRARSRYAMNQMGAWTKPHRFTVIERIGTGNMPALAQRAVIPNRAYPPSLYSAPRSTVQNFLAQNGFLENQFADLRGGFDSITLAFTAPGQETLTLYGHSWPAEKIYPGLYKYKFQLGKAGFLSSEPSKENSLQITMEPPRLLGAPQFGDEKEGMGAVRAEFTPILFAEKYEIQLSSDPSFLGAKGFQTKDPVLVTRVPTRETTFWRVRALDGAGVPLTDFSQAGVIMHDTSVPAYLAVNDRDPATEQSVLKPEGLVNDNWTRSEFWAWLGGGYNFTDYRQSIPGRGTLDFRNVIGPTRYFEAGISRKGLGGLFTYKENPGKIMFDNASVDRDIYNWMHYSLEAQIRARTPIILWNRPVIVGYRLGLQHHQVPFVLLNGSDQLEQKTMKMDSASAGGLIQWSRANWNYYGLLRYQFPLVYSAEGSSRFKLNPIFAFDGSIGTSYDITKQWRAGAFWYGQWHQFDFTYSDGQVSNKGFQSLFYSTVDLRLGFQW